MKKNYAVVQPCKLVCRPTVIIFGGCAGGMARRFRYARSLRRLQRFLLLAAHLPNILTVLKTKHTSVTLRNGTGCLHWGFSWLSSVSPVQAKVGIVDYALVILITFYTHTFHTSSSWLSYMFRPILVIVRPSCMCCELLHCIFIG
jgi:hypothetical protein